jgi:GxxExxY protein
MTRHFDESEYPDQKLTGEIIGAFYYVYHSHGFGFLESVYKKALAVELRYRGIHVAQEVPFELTHRGVSTGTFRADLIAEGRIVLEAKTGTALDASAGAQLQNYLRASQNQIGLILHFGAKPAVKRLIASRPQLGDMSSLEIRNTEQQRLTAETTKEGNSVV